MNIKAFIEKSEAEKTTDEGPRTPTLTTMVILAAICKTLPRALLDILRYNFDD